jgi:DNA polymerase-3 subunit alpha
VRPEISPNLGEAFPVASIPLPPFSVPAPFMVTLPADDPLSQESQEPRMVTVVLRSTGDRERDVRRIKMAHGKLRSCPGRDRFSFLIFEGSRQFLLDFPNDTTGISTHLIQKLIELVGEENVRVEPIRIH